MAANRPNQHHLKEIEFYMHGTTYALTVDAEDMDNLIIEEVTVIDGRHKRVLESEIDPEGFMSELDEEYWQRIRETIQHGNP